MTIVYQEPFTMLEYSRKKDGITVFMEFMLLVAVGERECNKHIII